MAVADLPAFDALVADDDDGVRGLLVDFLGERGLRVASASDGRAAVTALERSAGACRLVFTDIGMPGADGFEVLTAARDANARTYVVMITGYGSLDTAIRAVRLGAQDYLTKPFSLAQVDLILQQADVRAAGDERQLDSPLTEALAPIHDRLDILQQLLRDLHDRLSSFEPPLRQV